MVSPYCAIYRIPLGIADTSSYLVRLGGEGIIVDTGMPGTATKIHKFLKECDIRKVSGIVLTHYHVDHAGSAAGLKRFTGAPVFAHEEDEPFISGEREPERLDSMPEEIRSAYSRYRAVKVDRKLRDGDDLFGFKVIHVPGHTPGSIALYNGTVLFSGDSLSVVNGRVQASFGNYDSDKGLASSSAKRLLELEYEMLLPGHGMPLNLSGSASE